jgi:PAS domain S-box-containing protein
VTQAKKTILVVEDERIVAKDLARLLTSFGWEARPPVASAEEALRSATEQCPDLVLMDIRIHGKPDGIDTAALLRKRFDVPVVFLTAHSDEETVARAKKTEPFGYLLKPIKPAELRSTVELALYRHEMERRLRHRERWFSTTLRSIADAVIASDTHGNVTFMNPNAESMTGWRSEDAAGRPLSEVLQVVAEQKHGEKVLVGKQGTKRPIAESAAPIYDELDHSLGAVMVFRDVSEERKLRIQLERADRLASLGTMAAGVAHEVNNPLAVIVANLAFVKESLARLQLDQRDAVDMRESLEEATQAAGRIRGIVTDLRVFTRGSAERGRFCDLEKAIDAAIQIAADDLLKCAGVKKIVPKLPPIDAPETRVVQIFTNLLMNAAHAIESGRASENEVRIRASMKSVGWVEVEISDTGSGIEPQKLRRIFDPFFTTKAPGGGIGLGLSICHGIARSLGGDIEVESAVGEGTKFRVTLPVSVAPFAEPEVEAPEPDPSAKVRGRILVVDDEPLIRRAIARALAEHELIVPQSATDARELLKQGARFDLILCDLIMPDVTGIELYEWLLEKDPLQARRVAFISGGALSKTSADFLSSVPNLLIEKPFTPVDLRRVVSEALAERHV